MTNLAIKPASQLIEISTEELKSELARALEITAENLLYLAKLWRELERRGEDLSELRSGLRTFLPLIADGRLDAQAAVQFAGNFTMLRALAALPIETQRKIASGEPLPVVLDEGGKIITRKLRADELTAKLIKRVFSGPNIRSIEEQRALVSPQERANPKAQKFVTIRMSEADWLALRRHAAEEDQGLQEYILSKVFDR